MVKSSCDIAQYNAQSQMRAIAIAIALAHDGFGAVVLALHKAIGNTHGQKLEKGEDFVSPVFKGRESFAQRLKPKRLVSRNPGIQ